MTTPNRVTEIEEVVREHTELIKTKFRYDHSAEKDWLRSKLTTLVAEAEARGRKMAVEYIKENSTGVIVGRTENDVPILGHWILKPETLEAALTNHTV